MTNEQFFDAAYSNDITNLRLGISKGIDPDIVDEDGWTALCWAVNYSHLEATEFLLNNKANVNFIDKEKESVLMIAIQAEEFDLELLNLLIEKGAEIDYQDSIGWSALSHAVAMDDADIVEFLLSKGANPDIKSKLEDDEDYESPREMVESNELKSIFANYPVR